MKNQSAPGLLILLISLSFFIFNPDEISAQEKNKESAESKLKDKVEQLEKKIQKQQAEIDGLKKELEKLKTTPPRLAVPELKDNDSFRKGKPFKFNGKIYYMVPLNSIKSKNENQKVK
jgi:Skp family chaperone for outer membrane proteins